MNMYKIMLALLFTLMFSSSCFAYSNAYEPEDNDAVSFSSYSLEGATMETTFVNYTDKTNAHEYWLRISSATHHTKLLNHLTLFIDNVPYDLYAIPNPSEKYVLAGQTVIDNSNTNGFFGVTASRSNMRYFVLSPEIVQKLLQAQSVRYVYNMVSYINVNVNIPEKFLKNIKETYALTYADFPNYWKPNDRSKKE